MGKNGNEMDLEVNSQHPQKKKKRMLVIIIVSIVAVLGLACMGLYYYWDTLFPGQESILSKILNLDPNQVSGVVTIEDETSAEDGISVPGYSRIKLKANSREQVANFIYNPESNTCYFEVSLYLPNGKQIYKSGDLAPGNSIADVKLNTVLAKGVYEHAKIKYECFDLETLAELNGAEVDVTLEVV